MSIQFAEPFSLEMDMLKSTNPYSEPIEKLVYTCCEDNNGEVHDFCEMLKRNERIKSGCYVKGKAKESYFSVQE